MSGIVCLADQVKYGINIDFLCADGGQVAVRVLPMAALTMAKSKNYLFMAIKAMV